jgi:hypothetical protein
MQTVAEGEEVSMRVPGVTYVNASQWSRSGGIDISGAFVAALLRSVHVMLRLRARARDQQTENANPCEKPRQ